MTKIITYKSVLGFLLLIVFSASCQRSGLTPAGFAAYCKDPGNGLIQTYSSGTYSFKLNYKPQQLMALQQIGKPHPRRLAFDSVLTDFNESEYFVLKVLSDSMQTEKKLHKLYAGNKYDSVMNYLRFNMRGDFYLTRGKDTLRCAEYELENSGGVDPALTFALAFNKYTSIKDTQGDLIFHFQDKIFQHNPLVIGIKEKSLKAIPALQLD